jgi:hypothetical protein
VNATGVLRRARSGPSRIVEHLLLAAVDARQLGRADDRPDDVVVQRVEQWLAVARRRLGVMWRISSRLLIRRTLAYTSMIV